MISSVYKNELDGLTPITTSASTGPEMNLEGRHRKEQPRRFHTPW